jgi:hypothetical protein
MPGLDVISGLKRMKIPGVGQYVSDLRGGIGSTTQALNTGARQLNAAALFMKDVHSLVTDPMTHITGYLASTFGAELNALQDSIESLIGGVHNLFNYANYPGGALETLIGSGNINNLDDAVAAATSSAILRHLYKVLYNYFIPDVTGYVLIFMVLPELSGLGNINDSIGLRKFITFAGVDFTPPVTQISSENYSSRSGKIPFATEIVESEQCSVNYIEAMHLPIYSFHLMWAEYIRNILNGIVVPDSKYLDENSPLYGHLDYAGSFYVVKFAPDGTTPLYLSKCIGVFPQSLPSKEIIGSRTNIELTMLPLTYYCSAYRECNVFSGGLLEGKVLNSWVFHEWFDMIISMYYSFDEYKTFKQEFKNYYDKISKSF